MGSGPLMKVSALRAAPKRTQRIVETCTQHMERMRRCVLVERRLRTGEQHVASVALVPAAHQPVDDQGSLDVVAGAGDVIQCC